MDIDLSNIENTRTAAETYLHSGKELHILINNAGIMSCPLSNSYDGYELQFAINYLGHFVLTEILLPLLSRCQPSRIINLSSAAHMLLTPPNQGIYWDRLPLHATTELTTVYDPWECYGISKLCLAMYAYHLQDRSNKSNLGITACSLHPGAILSTGLKQYVGLNTFFGMVSKTSLWGFTLFSSSISKKSPVTKSIPQGVATTITIALDPDIVPGAYYSDCQPLEKNDKYLSPYVQDLSMGNILYIMSKALTKPGQKAIKKSELENFMKVINVTINTENNKLSNANI